MNERAYIPYPERLAATLGRLLPQEQLDQLRRAQVEAQVVISLFHFDHVKLHAMGGSDRWFNLDPKEISPHREKSRRDTSIVAKSKRILRKEAESSNRLLAKYGVKLTVAMSPELAASLQRPRRKAKIASRGFDKSKTRTFAGKVRPRKARRQ